MTTAPAGVNEDAAELHGELRDELTRALQRVPELFGRELTFTALSGGITNRNFLVAGAPDGSRYVVRLAGNRDDVDFRKLGAVSLKGMALPVEVYEALPI